MSIYDYSFTDNKGNTVQMSDFKDRVLLLVNTASECGFTKQYEGLQLLHKEYEAQGLKVIGFPSNQFGNQEPGTDAEIQEFCSTRYGVDFLMSTKIDVRGENAHPIYKYLTSDVGREVLWNFDKFIIDKNGKVYALSSDDAPDKIKPFILSLLN